MEKYSKYRDETKNYNMTNYFKFTGEIKKVNNKTLHRVQLTRNCQHGKKGDIGGWVEKKSNLQGGWVYDEAKIFNNVLLLDNSTVYNNAELYDNVELYDDVRIYDNVKIYNNVRIFNNVNIYDNVKIFNDAIIMGASFIENYAIIKNKALIKDNAIIKDKATIENLAIVQNNALIQDNSIIKDMAIIRNNSIIKNDTIVGGTINIINNTELAGGKWNNRYVDFEQNTILSNSPLQIQGSHHYINMYNEKELKIDSLVHIIDYWKDNYEKILRTQGYNDSVIKECGLYIDLADKIYNRYNI